MRFRNCLCFKFCTNLCSFNLKLAGRLPLRDEEFTGDEQGKCGRLQCDRLKWSCKRLDFPSSFFLGEKPKGILFVEFKCGNRLWLIVRCRAPLNVGSAGKLLRRLCCLGSSLLRWFCDKLAATWLVEALLLLSQGKLSCCERWMASNADCRLQPKYKTLKIWLVNIITIRLCITIVYTSVSACW